MAKRKNSNGMVSRIRSRFSAPTDRELEEIAKKLEEWSQREDAIRTTDFMAEHGLPASLFYMWAPKNKRLNQALEMAHCRIAERRERQATKKASLE